MTIKESHSRINKAEEQIVPEILSTHPINEWVKRRSWQWFPHQLEMLEKVTGGSDAILLAPTGAGKTLSGFLPALVDLHATGSTGHLHTLYISPLKALAVDVHRNLGKPVEDLALPISYETRTGDTPTSRRARQKIKPPDILMTTPESLALMVSYEDSKNYFKHLKYIIIDELHAIIHSKRADLLSLNLERLRTFAPKARRIGLSATVADKKTAKQWLCRRGGKIVEAPQAVPPCIEILQSENRIPWSGHSARYAVDEIYAQAKQAKMAIVFVNTRAQAESMFQNLWLINKDKLKIGIHHGSLEKELRRKVEAYMARGELDCVVATGSLDLGLDWADVDLVIQVGAPKGVSRLLQRIGRSNHRLDEPSRALLVPTNRLEYVECVAAIEEIKKGNLDGTDAKLGGLDVLAQHILSVACCKPFQASKLYEEVIRAWPYRTLSEEAFKKCLSFVVDGGYALKAYDRFSRLIEDEENSGVYRLREKKDARRYRMNVGTIVEAPLLKVMLRNRNLGAIEESFVQNLSEGDTFLFGGKILTYQGVHNAIVKVSRSKAKQAMIPSYTGGRMPLSTHLAHSVSRTLGNPRRWADLPPQVTEWLELQRERSSLPDEKSLLVESFPHKRKHYLVAYTFAGRNSNQTLGLLAMRRMKKMDLKPLGYVTTDYSLAIWSFKPVENGADIFDPSLMSEHYNEWLMETPMIRRQFRDAAVISGLIERRHPGHYKTGRQVLVSSDLIFDVLTKYDPDHLLIQAAHQDARYNLVDADRVNALLKRVEGKVRHQHLKKISPLAVPALLQISSETLSRKDREKYILEDMESEILEEAGLDGID